ncbi:alpha/beta hydrolase [Ferroacidibacillus organovorans]|uniref:Dienelactone hydrolase domain-containing protein n=1 Tax=Ferroacidibacillus organovorans TaxID=1765683 RepID=A0A124IW56_9BACL|nr:alpha/beta hydrolase [Ferroacidibacillus organovorans]KUO96379.1 hypothetical protein ATW55_03425 [Ferroacidibacillus organovorans]
MDFHHTFVRKQGHSKKILILLHGTGGDENDLLSLGAFLAPEASLLGIRGKVKEGQANRFFRRLSEGVFDEEDLIFRTRELAAFLEEAKEHYGIREGEWIAVGYSNGANIAASLLLLEPEVLSAAILFRAMMPLTPSRLPDLLGHAVFMSSGREDPIVPNDSSERLEKTLVTAGAVVSHEWQNAGHGLLQSEFVSAKVWLSSHMG